MQRLSTTVIAVVGVEAEACLRSLNDARNVRVVQEPPKNDPSVRAMDSWSQAARSRSLYTVHNADPLEPVVSAWTETFAGGPRGNLEVAVTETIARWRSESIGLPDFYLVVDPGELPAGRRDWYLGVLHQAAPHRVIPVEAEGSEVRTAIASLSHGRWWPEVPELLDHIEHAIPDQAMLANSEPLPASSDETLSDILL